MRPPWLAPPPPLPWRPRRRSPGALAADIAASIKARIAEGRGWSLADYGIDQNPEMAALVAKQLEG